MSNFYLNQLKLNSDFDKSALLLWVFHVDKKAPHAGISFNEKYFSSKVNGKDVDFPVDSLISIINSKKIAVLIFELKDIVLKISLNSMFSEEYTRIQHGDSCLTPIIKAMGKTDQSYILDDLIHELNEEQNIINVFGLNLPEGFQSIPTYDFEFVQKRLAVLRENGK